LPTQSGIPCAAGISLPADDEAVERKPHITATAYFGLDKLAPKGRERNEESIEYLAEKFAKENLTNSP